MDRIAEAELETNAQLTSAAVSHLADLLNFLRSASQRLFAENGNAVRKTNLDLRLVTVDWRTNISQLRFLFRQAEIQIIIDRNTGSNQFRINRSLLRKWIHDCNQFYVRKKTFFEKFDVHGAIAANTDKNCSNHNEYPSFKKCFVFISDECGSRHRLR